MRPALCSPPPRQPPPPPNHTAAGYAQPLAGTGQLGLHRTVEAMKHAFALRMSLGA